MSRMNAGETGRLAFETDATAYEPIQPSASSRDFTEQPPDELPSLDSLVAHLRNLDTPVCSFGESVSRFVYHLKGDRSCTMNRASGYILQPPTFPSRRPSKTRATPRQSLPTTTKLCSLKASLAWKTTPQTPTSSLISLRQHKSRSSRMAPAKPSMRRSGTQAKPLVAWPKLLQPSHPPVPTCLSSAASRRADDCWSYCRASIHRTKKKELVPS